VLQLRCSEGLTTPEPPRRKKKKDARTHTHCLYPSLSLTHTHTHTHTRSHPDNPALKGSDSDPASGVTRHCTYEVRDSLLVVTGPCGSRLHWVALTGASATLLTKPQPHPNNTQQHPNTPTLHEQHPTKTPKNPNTRKTPKTTPTAA